MYRDRRRAVGLHPAGVAGIIRLRDPEGGRTYKALSLGPGSGNVFREEVD